VARDPQLEQHLTGITQALRDLVQALGLRFDERADVKRSAEELDHRLGSLQLLLLDRALGGAPEVPVVPGAFLPDSTPLRGNRTPVEALDEAEGVVARFDSLTAAAAACGDGRNTGYMQIRNAVLSGKPAFGYRWRKADI